MKLCFGRGAAGLARLGRSTRIAASAWAALAVGLGGGTADGGSKPSETGTPAPTYTRDVAPILRKHCQGCHRKGQVGPFGLETYEQARKRSADIASVTGERTMPPWKPRPDVGPRLKHDRSLPAAEVATLKAWAEAGAPQGDALEVKPAAHVSEPGGWSLGTPDLVLETAEDFAVPASGPDLYRCFVIPSRLPRDVHLAAVEYRPGNRRVVHHMQAYVNLDGDARRRDAEEAGPGYTSYSGAGVEIAGDMGGWTPGNDPVRLPDGIGRLLPARSDVVLQVHYHPSGKPEVDRTRIALYFCKTPVKRTLHWSNASNDEFRLAAGNANAEVKATWFVPVDVEALAVTPHMHALGHDFRISVTYPNGRTVDLLEITDWDPSWQDTYYFEKPVSLPKGSTVRVLAHYDNSSHPRNPNAPPRLVKRGPQATDEMCVGYIGVVKKDQDLTRPGEKDDLFEILLKQYTRKLIRGDPTRRGR